MNFSEMSKEQKQFAILGVMSVVTVVFVLSNLVIGPMQDKAEKLEKQLKDTEPKVRRGESILKADRKNIPELKTKIETIQEIVSSDLPPENGRYLWALQRVSAVGHSLGLTSSVRIHSRPRHVSHKGEYNAVRKRASMWVPYAVDVELNCSYEDLKAFISQLYNEDKFARISLISIQPNQETPEKHSITLLVEWPVFRDSSEAKWLEQEPKPVVEKKKS